MKLVSKFLVKDALRYLLFFAIACAAILPSVSFAQAEYETLPLYSKDKKEIGYWNDMLSFMRDDLNAVRGMLEGSNMDQTAFDKFFNDVVFPLFTYEKNYEHPSVPTAKIRKNFQAGFIARAKNNTAKEHLFDLTLAKMSQIAEGNFDPRARANAVIMIAELNDPEPGPPLKKTFPVLLKWSADPKMPDVVRIPAFRGLERHALTQGGIEAAQRPAVVQAMLVIVKQHTATPEQSLEGHEWILRRATDVLAALGEPGDKGLVFNELVKLTEEESAPRAARATAAAALTKIRYVPPKDYDAESLAKTLGKLAVTVYKAELAEVTPQRQPIVVERLKQQLREVRTGLVGADGKGGIAAMLSADPQKKFVADLVTNVDNLIKACDTPAAQPPDPLYASQNPGYVPGVPFDTQEPIAKAISTAGSGLEAVLQAGVGGNVNPPALPGATPPPVPGAARPATVKQPSGLPAG